MPNVIDAAIPEMWAGRTLDFLGDELVLGALVNRDFDDAVAQYGDTVHTRVPTVPTAAAKTVGTDYTDTDAQLTDVAVLLDQHYYVSYVFEDAERAKSLDSLEELFIQPAAQAIAQQIESSLADLFTSFTNAVGDATTNITESLILEARKTYITNKGPMDRNVHVVLHPNQEAELLQLWNLMQAHTVDDGGVALKEGLINRRYGLNFFRSSFVPTETVGGSNAFANLLFHRNAIILLSRRLPDAPDGLGAKSVTVSRGNFAIRATTSYDSRRGGVRVTIESLWGVKVAQDALGVKIHTTTT